MDLNHYEPSQSRLCYHYITGYLALLLAELLFSGALFFPVGLSVDGAFSNFAWERLNEYFETERVIW